MPAQKDLMSLLSILDSSIFQLVHSPSFGPSLRSLSDVQTGPPPPAMDPHDVKNTSIAIAAALQLLATLKGGFAALEMSTSFHQSTCARLVIAAHVVETIRESGKEEGLHVDAIAKSSGVDSSKLARILRYLATSYCFVETAPNVFANTTVSLGFDTGKSLKELHSTPFFYEDTDGGAAIDAHCADESLKGSAYLTEALLDATAGEKTAFELAHGLPFWPYLAREGNEARHQRFQAAMNGITVRDKLMGSLFDGYPFQDLPQDAVIVDCGGGVGSVSLELIQKIPHLKVIVQDLSETISGPAAAFWAKEAPELVESGRSQLMVHDFFTPQPVGDASLYLLRFIIHDWSTSEAIKILRHLSDAAKVKGVAKLLLIEHEIDYLCQEDLKPKPLDVVLHGSTAINLPPPLVATTTHAFSPYFLDMHMMTVVGGQERTLSQYQSLGLVGGWKLEEVYQGIAGGRVHLLFGLV